MRLAPRFLALLGMTKGRMQLRRVRVSPPSCHSEGNVVTVGIQRSEMRLRLDCHVATFVASRNDKRKTKKQRFIYAKRTDKALFL